MSGQGSSSSDAVVRIEVYIDDATEATSTLTEPPFRFELDTEALTPGPHTLRVVRVDAAGRRSERSVRFTVEHEPSVEVRGLEDGATVSGRLDVDVVATGAPAARPVATRGPSPWLYILSTVLILGGIWVFFMLVPMYSAIVTSPSGNATASTAPAAPVDQQLLQAGETLYTSDCAACHQPSGQGMPPTFPALAGNSYLSDASAVVKRVYEGGGSMPSHPGYSAKDLAAVATYIRNTWGNSYGGVSVSDAAQAEPKASNPAGASAGGSSSSGAQAPSGSSSSGSSTSSSSTSSSSTSGSSTSGSSTSGSSTSGSSQSGGQASSGSSSSGSAGAASAGASATSAQALKSQGEKLYSSDCVSCHQPKGQGMPPTFPALAGNDFLKDPAAVVKRIFEGKNSMPSHPSYTATDLAAVATYIRESFGNSYGPVTVQEAKQAAPKAGQ